MEMKLKQLKISNFMGCKNLEIDFGGSSMKVYGDNATGKTTIQHAFNWLLFDKNAYNKTDFGIKPYDAAGETIHRLETTVEALFDVDGTLKSFKKVLREKWTRKRGSAEETYTGNEIDYYVNTVPKKKKEYIEEIAGMIDEEVFRMISNPIYFNESIDWKTRRAMLLNICGDISDSEIIALYPDLQPLNEELNGRTVEELKSIVSSEMKSINKELGIIPSRIAEAELAKPTPRDDVDVSGLEELEDQLRAKKQAKSDILNGAEIVRLKAERDTIRNEEAKKRLEQFAEHTLPEYKELMETDASLKSAEQEIQSFEDVTIPQIDFQLKTNTQRKADLSKEWDEVFGQAFLGSTCPTCAQELPPDQLEEKQKEFNRSKAMRLDAIETELKTIKERDAELLAKKEEAEAALRKSRVAYEKAFLKKPDILAVIDSKKSEFETAKEKIIKELEAKINDLEKQIANHVSNANLLVKGVEEEIAAIERKIAPIKDLIAEQNMIIKQNARILELKDEQQSLSGRYTTLERQLFLTEEFVRRKVALINEKVNSRFKYARFKLFDTQINGGIAETCEVTFKGIPYRDLNTAGRINIGLDIINTLSTWKGITAPIFIDNMESVTKPIDTLAQRIELIVSASDKELRFEKEETA